ncbi:MAG TPA: hypothetical protein VMH39_00735 [Gemmatimonadaceae bacterium]|nr:hypothetical protein [Gemmatimonadaceae bacterium]
MRLVVHWSLSSLPLAAAVVILESRPRDVPAAHEYAIAIAIGALLGAGVMSLHGRYIDRGIGEWAVGEDLDLRARYLYGAWVLAFWGAAGALLHAADLRHKRYSERLRGAELARIARQQRLAQANLAALHSRFEPDRLLASLRAIEIAYGADMPAADRMLDELIRDSRSASRRTSA